MFFNTHRYIGKFVGTTLEQNSDDLLNIRAFKYGCILPDITRKYKRIPHYKEQSFDFLQTLIQNLVDYKEEGSEDFSTQLGILAHYLGDYFCQVHNYKQKKTNIVIHLLYETRLMFSIHRAGLADICNHQFKHVQNELFESAEDITSFIEETHHRYLNENQSIKNDIKYAVETAFIVVASVINCSFPDALTLTA